MKDRIAHILKIKNLTATRFADELEVQRSGISHILSGRNKPSLDFIIKIKDTYPEFSLDWLILGKGPATLSLPSGDRNPAEQSYSLFDEEAIMQKEVDDQGFSETDTSLTEETEEGAKPQGMPTKAASPGSRDSSNAKKSVVKEIERVMLFYTDKSFEIYDPGG